MPLDQSYAGRVLPPMPPYEVGIEKIREFADAIGAADPAYHDRDAARALGHPDVIAPPTFPVVVAGRVVPELAGDPELGLDFSRVVHGDERFEYSRPVRAGDVLTCVSTIEEVTRRGGHDFLQVRTDFTAADGGHVVTVWAKIVVRGEG